MSELVINVKDESINPCVPELWHNEVAALHVIQRLGIARYHCTCIIIKIIFFCFFGQICMRSLSNNQTTN